MKVLIVFHGMPPIAGRTVVGSGLRAFANGEALRAGGHQVVYCTRHEDLPGPIRAKAERLRNVQSLLLTSATGPVSAPGERPRHPAIPGAMPGGPALPGATRGGAIPGAMPGGPAIPGAMPHSSATRRLDAVMGPAVGKPPEELSVRDLRALDWSDGGGLPPVEDGGWTPSLGLAQIGGPLGAPGNPFAFTEPAELQAVVQRVDPDVVLVESLEDARHLPEGHFSVILDLFAPRILEQQFQTGSRDGRESVRVLDALQRADHFLFSNERQKYFHLPLLALAGVDCRKDAGDVVPISCPPDLPPVRKPPQLTFVAGGVFWPWADLSAGLVDLLATLDELDAGGVRLYGGEYAIRSDTSDYVDPRAALPKDHARVTFQGMVPIDQLWDDYRKASVAFDLMAPNPEREINLSFRQVDYLRCGLPLITAPGQVVAPLVAEYGAGWLIEPGDRTALHALVRKLVANPKLVTEAGAGAQRLARERFAWDRSTKPLLAAVERPRKRQHGDTVIAQLSRTQADLWEEHAAAKRLRETTASQQTELAAKSEEVRAADAKVRQLMTSVDRLTLTLEEVSRFRTDTVSYLQQEEDAALREAAELQRELDRRDVDLKKKQDALDAARKEAEQAQRTTRDLLAQNAELQRGIAESDGEVLTLREQVQRLDERARAEATGLAAARRELEGKRAAVAEAMRRLDGLRIEAQGQVASARRQAEELLRDQLDRSAAIDQERARQQARAEQLAGQLAEADRRLQAAEETATAEAERLQELGRRERAEAARTLSKTEERARRDQEALERHAARELELLRAEAESRSGAAREEAEELLRQLLDRNATLDAERGRHRARNEQLAAQLADADRRVAAAETALVAAQERQAEASARVEAAHAEALAQRETAGAAALARLESQHEAATRRMQQQVEAQATIAERRALADLDALRTDAEARLIAAREDADARLRELLDKLAAGDAERGRLRAKSEQLAAQLADADRRSKSAETALSGAQERHAEATTRVEAAHAALLAQRDAAHELAKTRAEQALATQRTTERALIRERDDLRAALEVAATERDLARADAVKKAQEAAAAQSAGKAISARAQTEVAGLRADLERRVEAAADAATAILTQAEERHGRLAAEHAALRREATELEQRAADAERIATLRDAELRQIERASARDRERLVAEQARQVEALRDQLRDAQSTQDDALRAGHAALTTARAAEELARAEASRLKTELASARAEALKKQTETDAEAAHRLAALSHDNDKKTRALVEAQASRDTLEVQLLAAVAESEERARALLDAVVSRSAQATAAAAAERDALHLQIAELTVQVEQKDYAVRSLSTDANKKSRELAEAQAQRNAAQARAEAIEAELEALRSERAQAATAESTEEPVAAKKTGRAEA